MHTEVFKASTQYSDLKGSSAADHADKGGPRSWLESKGLLQNGEHIVGISMYVGENHGSHRDPVSVSFLLAPAENARRVHVPGGDAIPVVVRKLQVDMTVHEFLALFKRLEICMSPGGEFDGHPFAYTDF